MNKKSFTFTGSGDEYFKIWIVNILLTIVTLGIYSAWATVRTKRYFYGNTHLDDNNFEYHAKPMQILIGRVLAIVLLIAYVFLSEVSPIIGGGFILAITLVMPWVIMRSLKFNARMSSYRNVRFSFEGLTSDAYKIFLLIPLFPAVVGALLVGLLYLILDYNDEEVRSTIDSATFIIGGIALLAIFALVPLVETFIMRYRFNNLKYGQGQFFTNVEAKPIYMIYLKLVGVVALGYAIIAAIGAGLSQMISSGMGSGSEKLIIMLALLSIPAYLFFILFGIYTKAYIQSHKRNYLFSKTGLDKVLTLESNLKSGPLFKILATNLLLIIISVGFAKPWTMVRLQRHIVDRTHANIEGDLGQYVSTQQEATSSFGDEMGDAFDLEGGFEVGI
jgi:uncharacterized membrane protein YjgN (DUF898 family)